MTAPSPLTRVRTAWSALNGWTRAAVIFCSAVALGDVPTILYEAPPGHTSPPTWLLAAASVCGVVTLVAAALVVATRRRSWLLTMATARVVSVLLGVPSMVSDTVADQVRLFAIVSVPLGAFALLLVVRALRADPPLR